MPKLKDKLESAKKTGENLILTEEDLQEGIDNTGKEINGIEDLIAIHKTNFTPKGRIQTPYETGKFIRTGKQMQLANGENIDFEFDCRAYRNTIHFCLNGQVESHAYGNWDTVKYAVYIPLQDAKDNIVAGTECDIFSLGGVDIDASAYVLCPESEIEQMKQVNPQAMVVGYKGDSVSPYVNVFLSQALEYKQKEPTQSSTTWKISKNKKFGYFDQPVDEDVNDKKVIEDIFNEQGWEYTNHTGSKWQREEQRKMKTEIVIEILKEIKKSSVLANEENLPTTLDFIQNILLNSTNDMATGYMFTGDILSSPENLQSFVESIKTETGIDLSIVENEKEVGSGKVVLEEGQIGEYLKKEDATNKFKRCSKTIAKECTRQMQMQEIFQKHDNGEKLTDKEEMMYKVETEYGGWYKAIREGKISEEFIAGIEQFSTIKNKDINQLSPEELEFCQQFLSKKLEFMSADISKKGQSFSIRNISENSPEYCEAMKQWGMYVKPVEPGLKLCMQARKCERTND